MITVLLVTGLKSAGLPVVDRTPAMAEVIGVILTVMVWPDAGAVS